MGKVSTLLCLKYSVSEAGSKGDREIWGQTVEGFYVESH